MEKLSFPTVADEVTRRNHGIHGSGLTGVLLAGVVGFRLGRPPGPGEPVFEGRTLTSWLDHHVASSDARPPYNSPGWKKADEALRAIGTDGIPTLLKMIRAKDPPPMVLKMLATARRYGLTRMDYRYAEPRQREAEYAFGVLGTNAASAVPEFEVLELPASDNLNVSTLCVVANGQIILCARDNHRDVFVEIRRVEIESAK